MALGTDRVQLMKQESSTQGGDDADIGEYGNPAPISPQEDAIESAGLFLQDASARDEEVYVEREGDDMRFRDKNNTTPLTLSSLATGGSGLTPDGHRLIDQWVHFDLDENCYYEVTYFIGSRVQDEIWWTDVGKTQKIREINYTYTGFRVTQETRKSYDGAGVLVETLVIAYTYTGTRITSATYTRTT